jgi:hypothetical protein
MFACWLSGVRVYVRVCDLLCACVNLKPTLCLVVVVAWQLAWLVVGGGGRREQDDWLVEIDFARGLCFLRQNYARWMHVPSVTRRTSQATMTS